MTFRFISLSPTLKASFARRGERERERSRERRRERRERREGSLCCLLGQTGMHTCIQKRVMSSELEGQVPQGGGGR